MASSEHDTIDANRWSDLICRQPAVADARSLTSDEAAQLLNVSCTILHVWEAEFGFPTSSTPRGSPRQFPVAQLLALREALNQAPSIAAAVQAARHQLTRTS